MRNNWQVLAFLKYNSVLLVFFSFSTVSAITRDKIIDNAKKYANLQWYCSQENIDHPEYTQGGCSPCDFDVGWQTGEAYSYGRNDSYEEFLQRIAAGYGAGSHLCHYQVAGGPPPWATGIDCSAFVSRCWGISRQSTATLPNYSVEISRLRLQHGDILNIPHYHVRLFERRAQDGRPTVFEASGSAAKVVHRTVDWGNYTPRCLNKLYVVPPSLMVINKKVGDVMISWSRVSDINEYFLYQSYDGINFGSGITVNDTVTVISGVVPDTNYYFKVTCKDNFGGVVCSEILGVRPSISKPRVLIVNGFDRATPYNTYNFIVQYGDAIAKNGYEFSSCSNECIESGAVTLDDYDAVVWILGEESTKDETFSKDEQNKIRTYLENGGKLFVSGSEIGWDLDYKGNAEDKSFYHNYLKANFVKDDANIYSVKGLPGTIFEGLESIYFGKPYRVGYPDCIDSNGGSLTNLTYRGTDYGAGIQYSGLFGNGIHEGKLVYLGFPFETIYPESSRVTIMKRVLEFFDLKEEIVQQEFKLSQNIPNPFSSSTIICCSLSTDSPVRVILKVYNVAGQEIRNLIDEYLTAGTHTVNVEWDGTNMDNSRVSSGVYFYQFRVDNFIETKKIIFLK